MREMNGDSPSTTLIRYSNDGHGVLLKDTLLLGSGRCASVREASIAGAKCAAKTISPALCGSANSIEGMRGQVSRGCELWNKLRHPNLVPFLGIIDIPDSPLPALLTDHYHTNLHQFLLKSPTHDPHSVPLGLKISILRNVACGLAYLHMQTPPTPHGRLSAKKVLLDSGAVAKISVDVGVTVLPQPLEITPYMPLEVADTQSPTTTSVDVFSFGVLALFTLTHCLPDDILPATYTEELSKKPVCCTEIERRAQSVDKIFKELGKEHPLTRMVTECLAQEPTSRPTVSAAQSLLWQAAVLIPDPFEEKTKFDLARDLATLSREHVRMRGEFETHDSELRDHIRALLQGMARQRKMLPRENDEEDEEMVTEREVAYIANFVEGIRAGRLGRELGVSEHALAIIECDPNSRRDENRKRAKVLVEWIRNTESPSWSGLVTALSSIGQKRVSDILTNDKGT